MESLAESIIDSLLNIPEKQILEEGSSIIKKEYSIQECVKKYINIYYI
jgi:hypothetical protein